MKRIFLLLGLLAGCGGEDFTAAPMHVVIQGDATTEAAKPDSGSGGSGGTSEQGGSAGLGGAGGAIDADTPESGQDALPEVDQPDVQDGATEVGQGGQAGSGGSATGGSGGAVPEAGPEPQPEACVPDKCAYHAFYYCGWLNDGCGGWDFCGHQYYRGNTYSDASCMNAFMPQYSWLCPINVQAPDVAGPAPMPGCQANPVAGTSVWCCPDDTIPPHA